ncbi:MAG: MATE family efflux transporter [Ruminococcaceae bacterium]|nr:MATE family efflux transporter [Oscillospiraceae bacterium]
MKKNKTLDMTNGSPTKLLLTFALPMLLGNLFQQVYNLVDSIIVGQFVGKDAFASIGATSSVTFLFFALCNGIASGGGIIVSHAFGGGDDRRIKSCLFNTAAVMLILPTIVGCTAFFLAEWILTLLKTPATVLPDALLYTRTMCIGIVFVSIYNLVCSVQRALGDSKSPLYFLIFSCILNALLDLLFVVPLQMGVFGAGLATIISQFVSAAVSLIYAFKTNPYFRLSRQDMKFEGRLILDIMKLGIPLSLQFSLIAISCMALQSVVNTFGETAMAAFNATGRIEQMLHQPYQTLSAALSTFCGQNYGARKNDRVISGYRKCMLIMALFTAMMVPVIQLFAEPMIRIFIEDAEVISMGAAAMRITSIFYIALGVIYIVRGVLNGLGDASFALLNGIVEVIGRFVVPVLLITVPAIGVWGIWWSVGVVWSLSGLTAWLRYLVYKRRLGIRKGEHKEHPLRKVLMAVD